MKYQINKSIECDQGVIRAIRYNVDGNYCLVCSSDRKVRLINPKTGLKIKNYEGHSDEVVDAAGSCDSANLISGSADKSLIYWDVATGVPLRRLRTHNATVSCVKFNEDSTVAVTGSRDNSIQLFDIRSRSMQPIQTLKEAKDCITGLHVTSHKIISSSLDGVLRQYDIRAGELVSDFVSDAITSLSMTTDEQCALVACQDGAIRLVDIDGGEALVEYKGHEPKDYKIECAVLESDSYIMSGTSFGHVIIWDFLEANEVSRLKVSHSSIIVQSLCRHPTRQDTFLVANRREIQVWQPPDQEIIEDDTY